MNPADPFQRQGLIHPSGGSARSVGETTGSSNQPAIKGRAERFEDEKRRIIESCFGKKDADGSVQESYITHIRITEDAAHPSTPPPPTSPPENKKGRFIIVAVRKSGRVRMHKARENSNGTFSVGKSWALDDLTAIESFSHAVTQTPEEEQRKEWADGIGFIVTIQKPYYWEAGTNKEKEFFITSLVKIYRKYTGGKTPFLLGFDQKELDQMTGTPAQQQQPPRGMVPSNSNEQISTLPAPLRPDRGQPPPLQPGFRQGPRPQPSREQVSSRPGSRDPGQRPFAETPTLATPPPLKPQSSQSHLSARAESPAQGSPFSQHGPKKLHDYQSFESFRSGQEPLGPRPPGQSPYGGRFVSPSGHSPDSRSNSLRPDTPQSSYNTPPSRDGAPSVDLSSSTPQPSDLGKPIYPDPTKNLSQRSLNRETPDDSTSVHQHPGPPGVPETDPTPRIKGASGDVEARSIGYTPSLRDAEPMDQRTNSAQKVEPLSLSTLMSNKSSPAAIRDTPTPLPEPPAEPPEEVHRPGLGPMIKKKSSRDVAGAFRKAAVAYNAFKPRAGGAGERLRERSEASNGPDGISAVVPAPSLVRNASQEVPKPPPAETSKVEDERPQGSVPQLKVSTSNFQDTRARPESPTTPINQTEFPRTRPPTPPAMSPKRVQSMRKKKVQSEILHKQLAALDINPALLEGRSLGVESIFDEFGWPDNKNHSKKLEMFEADMRKELGRVEAGSWLNHIEHKDTRVDEVEKLLDKATAECEELEGLLTLYGVELSTLDDDVAFIESQSEGLSVRAANERLLQAELQQILQAR